MGEKPERRNQSIIFRFTKYRLACGWVGHTDENTHFSPCWGPWVFWSHKLMETFYLTFFVFLSLNFWSKVCCTSGHKSWAGGRTSCSIYSQHHNLLTVPTFAFLLPHIFRLSGLLKEKLGEEVSGEGRFQKVKSLFLKSWGGHLPKMQQGIKGNLCFSLLKIPQKQTLFVQFIAITEKSFLRDHQ